MKPIEWYKDKLSSPKTREKTIVLTLFVVALIIGVTFRLLGVFDSTL